jgi:hypothetical protein
MEKLFFSLGRTATFILTEFFLPFLLAAMKYFCEKTGGWSPVRPRQFFLTQKNLKL